MHFNNKHIFLGDSETEIKKKINYNFDQILSFAIGPDGHPGPKGSIGFPGPGGYKGATGATGLRGALWYKQNIQPSSPNVFDLWIDTSSSDYKVYSRSSSGPSWAYTGYALFNSPIFQSYSGIVGPAGITDKFAIGIKSGAGLTASSTNLVISDSVLSPVTSNPNGAKVLVATTAQTERPIFDFAKTGSVTNSPIGFYWADTGTFSSIKLKAEDGLDMISGGNFTVDTYSASSFLFGNSAKLESNSRINIIGTSDFKMSSNTTVGSGGNLALSSSNLFLSSSLFSSNDPIQFDANTGATDAYVFDSTKNLPSGITTSSAGLEVLVSSSVEYSFEFRDLKGATIFSGKPRGSASSGKHAQITFGSTGAQTGGATGGPYFYSTKRINEVKLGAAPLSAFRQTANTTANTTADSLLNCFDLSNTSYWNSDLIVLTPTSYQLQPPASGYAAVFIRIPSSISNTLDGVYYSGTGNSYRIMLNDNSGTTIPRYIYGLIFSYFTKGALTGAITQQLRYITFESSFGTLNSQCQYIDIFYSPISNLNNANPRVFWKTCNGMSGYITLSRTQSWGQITTSGIINLANTNITGKGTVA